MFIKKRKAARVDSFSNPKSNPVVNLNVAAKMHGFLLSKHEFNHVRDRIIVFCGCFQ